MVLECANANLEIISCNQEEIRPASRGTLIFLDTLCEGSLPQVRVMET